MKRKVWIAALIAVAAALLPLVVAADAARFDATTGIAVVGGLQFIDPGTATPMDTVSRFKTDEDGRIKEVRIETTNEFVTGIPPGLAASCQPVDDAFCADLTGAIFTSLHNSRVKVSGVLVVPGSGLFAGKSVLIGDIKGKRDDELQGVATISRCPDPASCPPGTSPDDVMTGSITLRIGRHPGIPPQVPTAVYGCIQSLVPLVPIPLDVSSCEAGAGNLIPLALNIRDEGRIRIDDGSGVFAGIERVGGTLTVDVLGGTGVATVTDGTVQRRAEQWERDRKAKKDREHRGKGDGHGRGHEDGEGDGHDRGHDEDEGDGRDR